jgi:glucose-6-phosphate isomerase
MPEQTSLSELLAPHAARMAATHLRDLLREDLDRFARFSQTACDLLIDWSKEKLDEETWRQLLTLAEDNDVIGKREAMLRGEPINATENRAVLHTALRGGAKGTTGSTAGNRSGKNALSAVCRRRSIWRDCRIGW